MSRIVGIRTYRWGEEEERLFEALHPVLGDDLVAVVQNPGEDFEAPLPVISVSDEWIETQGLAHVAAWGWRCGDYAYYALRQARPGCDYYWLVEPDIYFTSSPGPFFAAFDDDEHDLLGLELKEFDRKHRFGRGMPADLPLWFTIFALTRMSGRALDRLVEKRRAMNVEGLNRHTYPNDEVFCFSHAVADPDLSVGCLLDRAGDWFAGSIFTTDPDMIVEQLQGLGTPPGRIYHPVRSRSACKSGIAKRANERQYFLKAITATMAQMDDDDIDDIVVEAGQILRRNLRRTRRQGWREARERG